MDRARIGRRGAGLVAASLVALQLLTGAASAADTRQVYFGSGPLDPPNYASNGTFTFSPVSAGGDTAMPVIVKNIDNQTLTHVIVTFPAFAAESGLSYAQVFGANAGACSPALPAASFSCDFGNLAKNATRTFTVLIHATASGTQAVTGKIQFNESTNPNGSNTHLDTATGNIPVLNGGCDLVATFLPPGQVAKSAGTDGCALVGNNTQTTKVTVPSDVVSAVLVKEEESVTCQSAFTCFGQMSIGDLAEDGTYTVTWTIQWQVSSTFNLNKLVLLKYKDNGEFDYALSYKKNLCATPTSTRCIVSAGVEGTTLTAVLKTIGNGGVRGGLN